VTDRRSPQPPRRSVSLVHGLAVPPRRSSGGTEPPSTAAHTQPATVPSHTQPPTRPTHPRIQARGTRRDDILLPGEQIRTMIFAPEATRASWIESELSRAPISITIQVGRKVRTVVSALVRDPEPRPRVLIVDFDAVSPGELLELHSVREEGWAGRLIGLGTVTPELMNSLGVDHVLAPPLVRDSLLDIVAGTRHAATTVAMPLIPLRDDSK
jgi:hypothetical protein